MDEYVEALRSLKIGAHHAAMFRAHANATEQTLTATELAKAAGYDGYEIANVLYGKLGHEIADYLGLRPQQYEKRNDPFWTSILVEATKEPDEGGRWRWTMHPELVEALRVLNMA